MSGAPARRLLGTVSGIAERVRVYRTAEALEIDQMEYYNIRRRRVFFDEVELVTLHSKRGMVAGAVFCGILALLVGISASPGGRDAGSVLFSVAGAFALGCLISLLAPVWTVTVFGKRTRARSFAAQVPQPPPLPLMPPMPPMPQILPAPPEEVPP